MFKNWLQGKKAVFFDLDGTIAQTGNYWIGAYETVLNEIGLGWVSVEDYYEAGTHKKEIWKRIIRANKETRISVSLNELLEKTCDYYIEIIKKSDLGCVPGFWELSYELKEEKKLKLALVTNSPKKVTDAMVEKLGMGNVFDLILTSNDVRRNKPKPDIYKKAARKLKVRPKEVLVFEDSVTGSKSATKAKMDTVVIYDETVDKTKYPQNIIEFIPDFDGIAGNLDKTYLETLIETQEKETQQ